MKNIEFQVLETDWDFLAYSMSSEIIVHFLDYAFIALDKIRSKHSYCSGKFGYIKEKSSPLPPVPTKRRTRSQEVQIFSLFLSLSFLFFRIGKDKKQERLHFVTFVWQTANFISFIRQTTSKVTILVSLALCICIPFAPHRLSRQLIRRAWAVRCPDIPYPTFRTLGRFQHEIDAPVSSRSLTRS